jgi:hypothetical protein
VSSTLHAVVEVADPSWESACAWTFWAGGYKLVRALDVHPEVAAGWPPEETFGRSQAELGENIYNRVWCPGRAVAGLRALVGPRAPTVVTAFAASVAVLCALVGGDRVRVLFYRD